MECMSNLSCNGLFSIDEDGFGTRRMICFCKLFGRYQDPQIKFHSLRVHSYTLTHNTRIDNLARVARQQSSYVVYMDTDLPSWFTEF